MLKTEPSIGKKAIFFTIIAMLAILALMATKTSSKGSFYFGETAGASDILFVESSRNFITVEAEMSFIEDSSIAAASSPLIYLTNSSFGTLASFEERGKEIIEYEIKEEETISSIAEKFDISVNTILWANNLNSKSVLKTGQKLAIPPVSGVVHEVKRGDTVSEIAKKYKAKAEDIVSFNELPDEGSIYIGDIIVVPNGEMPVIRPASPVQPSFSGFIVPVKGYITQGLHWYNAVDIANSCGTPVYASAAGTIQITGYHNIGGRYIRILHPNGMVTYYGHLSKISVSVNQKVSQGALIGYMGNTGYTIGATGCHLHFEVRGGTNPLAKYRVGHRF
ncbi:MAG: LysM peptidoglycan-binding domain-containing M23 family metallopeptidase [Candidatus Paceibacterota bacterium]|jgi:murein DD-endopeptidase MepM/ murein hydrolase activator NlpD|nr:LysM peptidoglycan-binding domain-containing M23 family metallopeptidase [Candidatus Paceibacterota bacterium]MDD4201671.1 LysM peptidoglycan-binding domain-containing M23 family metallopeptidase [Candidatus Paceibacterota bacterium]